MHTVLRTTAGRVSIALAITAGAAGAFAAPALASHAPRHPAPASNTLVQTGSAVEIGTAVAYIRLPDGSIRRVQ